MDISTIQAHAVRLQLALLPRRHRVAHRRGVRAPKCQPAERLAQARVRERVRRADAVRHVHDRFVARGRLHRLRGHTGRDQLASAHLLRAALHDLRLAVHRRRLLVREERRSVRLVRRAHASRHPAQLRLERCALARHRLLALQAQVLRLAVAQRLERVDLCRSQVRVQAARERDHRVALVHLQDTALVLREQLRLDVCAHAQVPRSGLRAHRQELLSAARDVCGVDARLPQPLPARVARARPLSHLHDHARQESRRRRRRHRGICRRHAGVQHGQHELYGRRLCRRER